MPSPEKSPDLVSRLAQDPGLPLPNPTKPTWQEPPSQLATIQSSSLPTQTDTLIIGSGITACSVASSLLAQSPASTVTILEARTLCSGATGRNGGHVKAAAVSDYAFWKPQIGKAAARKVVAFTFANSDALFELAAGLPEAVRAASEIRRVDSITVYLDGETAAQATAALKMFEEDNPEWRGKYRFVEKAEAAEKFGLLGAEAAYVGPAGAAWPYRLVTEVFAGLLARYPSTLRIETNTPALAVSVDSASGDGYSVSTPRGTIAAKRIIYCTNGHSAHLLPGLRGKLFPVRGHMTVQTPTSEILSDREAGQSWGIIHSPGLDYMTQNPHSGDLFLGGGLYQSEDGGRVDVGSADDTEGSPLAVAHLNNILPVVFGGSHANVEKPKIKARWSGVMGFTADGMPIVGRLPPSVTGRESTAEKVGGGEWIAAGFNGYGMVNAWLSGKAVAQMAAGTDVSAWLPEGYVCSENRLRQMKTETFIDGWFGGETPQAVEV